MGMHVNDNDVYAILNRYSYNELLVKGKEVTNTIDYIERNYQYMSDMERMDADANYQDLLYKEAVLARAVEYLTRQQPTNAYNNIRTNRFVNQQPSSGYTNNNGIVNVTTRGYNNSGNTNFNSGVNVQDQGFRNGAVIRRPMVNQGTTAYARRVENTSTTEQTRQDKGENNMLNVQGRNSNGIVYGSNMPFACDEFMFVYKDGTILFSKESSNERPQCENVISELSFSTKMKPESYVTGNGEDLLSMPTIQVNSFKELADVLCNTYNSDHKLISPIIVDTLYHILEVEQDQLNIGRILVRDSIFGDDEWRLLDTAVQGKSGVSELDTLADFNSWTTYTYKKNIYNYMYLYIRGVYALKDGILVKNTIQGKVEVTGTNTYLNFFNIHSNFRNFMLTGNINPILSDIIEAAYKRAYSNFMLKKYVDFLPMNLILVDVGTKYTYNILVTPKNKPCKLSNDKGYIVRLCDTSNIINKSDVLQEATVTETKTLGPFSENNNTVDLLNVEIEEVTTDNESSKEID